jgi:hypothetical protein
MHIPKWLIASAALLGVVMIAAIAFFLGRETSRPPAAAMAAPAVPQESAAARESASEESTLPIAAAPGPSSPTITPTVTGMASSYATPSNVVAAPAASTNSPATAETRARVAAYFEQMEALRSAGTGDQEEFATTIVNAAVSGDFSAIDDLIRTAGDAERRAAALQPPSECAEYHRLAVTLLGDSKTMITAIRDGLKRNDADALTSMAASAQSMKSRSENLSKAEQGLRARFGL